MKKLYYVSIKIEDLMFLKLAVGLGNKDSLKVFVWGSSDNNKYLSLSMNVNRPAYVKTKSLSNSIVINYLI